MQHPTNFTGEVGEVVKLVGMKKSMSVKGLFRKP